MLLQYSTHRPCRGHDELKAFITNFRKAFLDLNFWRAGELMAEGDYILGHWEGGGTLAGPPFGDLPIDSHPAAAGRAMRFAATTIHRVQDGKIVEEIGAICRSDPMPSLLGQSRSKLPSGADRCDRLQIETGARRRSIARS
jgi:predicted ester cyclase